MPDQEFRPDRSIRFVQIAACAYEKYDTIFGLDRNGRVWYYDWDDRVWVPLRVETKERTE